ncbi:MAG: response regulator [Polyangiaceae bacterium]|nr:response regulator [Polyangiaceae bacterium]
MKTEPNKTKVLVVDDDEAVLAATSYMLKRAGYDVDVTSEALGLPLRVGKFRPHIILLDVDLPAIEGPRIAQTLKGLRSAEESIIIFHSAEPEERLQRAVTETGAAGYIPKGLRRDDFLARLARFAGHRA